VSIPYPTSYKVTPREYEVWELLAHGASYNDIAHTLHGPTGAHLSLQTVKNIIGLLLRRVGVQSSAELIIVWYGGELLRPPTPEVEPPRQRPTSLKEKTTLFPTAAARKAAMGSDEERAARHAAHPWRHGALPPRDDVPPRA